MKALKAFFQDKQAQLEWSEFVLTTLNEEALKRVYAGKDTAAVKEAADIIALSFKKLNALFAEKRKPRAASRGV